jgi:hypothetical protein
MTIEDKKLNKPLIWKEQSKEVLVKERRISSRD